MVKTLMLRSLQVFAIAFVLSCLTTLVVNESADSSSMLTSLISPAEAPLGPAVAAW